MKVICIDISPEGVGRFLPKLTLDKMYDVIKEVNILFSPHRFDDPSGLFYLIKGDDGEEKHFQSNRFRELTLDEKRELKLDELFQFNYYICKK
jgi:hypothetical protein